MIAAIKQIGENSTLKEISSVSWLTVRKSKSDVEKIQKSDNIDKLIIENIQLTRMVIPASNAFMVNGQLPQILNNFIRHLKNNSNGKRDTSDWLFKLHIKNSALAEQRNKIVSHLIEKLEEVKTNISNSNTNYDRAKSLYTAERQALHLLAQTRIVNQQASELLGRRIDGIGSLDSILVDGIKDINAYKQAEKANYNCN